MMDHDEDQRQIRSTENPRIGCYSRHDKRQSTESQPVQQNNNPKPHRTLSESEIEELLSFFQLLDEWDREERSKCLSEE